MLNPESVDYFPKENHIVNILFTDDDGDECVKITLDRAEAQRLARMILKRTVWNK